ncbi:MAG: MBL fold metallo-hydrolase [Hydrogenophaga sp.]|uniref:MBL fold metallo-hydrolase n=1 Tax=Hydrogenophaga sp. TaxID=1904254 RepID=UPI001D9AA758|nr:MBL fold metallo-hydrolase [Hydrogenophaga sp.]MBX3611540.1 MBL fold metallo-hydrolase [Hydrogenophaga sp.]
MRARLLSILAWATASLLAPVSAHAVSVRFDPVADGVYAFVGETGGRTASNEGLNANIGLVVTRDGAVLIDSGATWQGARQIHEAVRRVTQQPVRWVINTGGQDHRWLGNAYFAAQGAELIGHADGRADMLSRGGEQLAALKQVLGPKADGTSPMLPTRWIEGEDARLELGGVVLELRLRGGAHTPGDMMVWLPDRQVLFSGDVVYVDRMLGVLPFSRTRQWLASFAEIERLAPKRIVPGHGRITTLAQAQADTRDYLLALREHMRKAVDDGTDISAAIKSFDGARFQRLANSAELMPGNGSRVYLEMERE